MKKLTLLGDSIRLIGYGTVLQDYLPDYEIYQPEENCKFSKYLLRLLFELKDKIDGSDVIHFNAGLWDTCALFNDGIPFTSLEEYKANISRIADILLRYSKRVVFSTITPTGPGQEHNTDQRIRDFNNAVVPMLLEKGVEVIDLYSLINSNIDEYIRKDDLVHLTDKGIKAAATLIASAIDKK